VPRQSTLDEMNQVCVARSTEVYLAVLLATVSSGAAPKRDTLGS